MRDPIWFWQRMASPHVAGLAASLADQGRSVVLVAEGILSDARIRQGWEAPDLRRAALRIASDRRSFARLAAEAPPAVHICQGLRANGLVAEALMGLSRRGFRPLVAMESVDDIGWRGVLKRLEYERLVRAWRKRVGGVLAIGDRTAEWILARGMPPEKVFPFAYFLADVKSAPILPQGSGPFRFLFVGQFIERKRLRLLIDSLAELGRDDAELWVIGSGPLGHELRERGRQRLGERLVWLGRRPQGEILEHMASADCLVLPSQHDGWGAVISEALLAGTPVVCSDRCGASGPVRASGAGGVFPADDGAALSGLLAEAISRGRPSPNCRRAIAAWAECLGARCGAAYLSEILLHLDREASRPEVPWETARTPLVPLRADEPLRQLGDIVP